MRSKLVGSTRLKTGEPVELYKAKGMSRGQFNFDDYIAMFDEKNPKPLEQEQTQFRLGLSGYCMDGGIKPITMRQVPKQARAQYTKGRVQADGTILPYEL